MRERTVRSERKYAGRVVTLDVLDVALDDGRRGVREIVRHAPAVGVLARAPDGRYLLVRQFRKAVEDHVLEVCAGINDPGEAPAEAARRELREETGYAARTMEHLGAVFSSPGYTDERIDLFFAECGERGATDFDADEHVEVVAMTTAELDAAVAGGRVRDAKTVAAWALHRRRSPA